MTFEAVLRKGGISLLDPEEVKAWARGQKDGLHVAMTLEPWKGQRSDKQNRLFHSILGRYADKLNLDKLILKDDLCIRHGISVEWGPAFDPPEWGGHFVRPYLQEYNDGRIWFRKSTKEYTTDEMSVLIDALLAKCFENQVDVSDLLSKYEAGILR